MRFCGLTPLPYFGAESIVNGTRPAAASMHASYQSSLVYWVLMVMACCMGCAGLDSAHTWSRDHSLRRMLTEPPTSQPYKYDERTDGGTLYKQHCSRCHNGRPLGERSFSQNEVSLAHMRNFSGLTGEEYRKILQYMRRWHGVGPATPDLETSPKRFFFDHPDNKATAEPESIHLSDEESNQDDEG